MPPKIYISNQHFPKKKRKNLLRFLMKSFRNDLQPLIIGNKLFILNAAVSPYIAVGVGYGYIRTKQSFSEIKDTDDAEQESFKSYDTNDGMKEYKIVLPAQSSLHDIYGQLSLGVDIAVHGPIFVAGEVYCGYHTIIPRQQRVRFDGGLSLMLGMQLPQKFKVAVGGGINCQNFDASIMPASAEKVGDVVTPEKVGDVVTPLSLRIHAGESIRPSGAFQIWISRNLGRQMSVRWEIQALFGKTHQVKKTWVGELDDVQTGTADFSHGAMHFRTNVAFLKSL